jgi:hypothetical protein
VPVDARNFGHWLNLLLGAGRRPRGLRRRRHQVFSAQPAVNSTITINGTAFTFVASGADRQPDQHRRSLSLTLDNAVTVLNASVVAGRRAGDLFEDRHRHAAHRQRHGGHGRQRLHAGRQHVAGFNGTVAARR